MSDVLYQLQSVDPGVAILVHYNRLKPYLSQSVSGRLEGRDESEQPPLRLLDHSTLQLRV